MKETYQLFQRGKKKPYFFKPISLTEIPYSELSVFACMPYMHYACVCQEP